MTSYRTDRIEPTEKLLQEKLNARELATYLAFFSVTYLVTSLKLDKFSVTERTAGGPYVEWW